LWHPIIDVILFIFAIDDVVHMWLNNVWHLVQFELGLYIIVPNANVLMTN
jgi:hypothetical protein